MSAACVHLHAMAEGWSQSGLRLHRKGKCLALGCSLEGEGTRVQHYPSHLQASSRTTWSSSGLMAGRLPSREWAAWILILPLSGTPAAETHAAKNLACLLTSMMCPEPVLPPPACSMIIPAASLLIFNSLFMLDTPSSLVVSAVLQPALVACSETVVCSAAKRCCQTTSPSCCIKTCRCVARRTRPAAPSRSTVAWRMWRLSWT